MSFITVTLTVTQTATPTAPVVSSTFITPSGRHLIIALSIVTGILIILCVVAFMFNRKMKKELQRRADPTQHERDTHQIQQNINPSPYDYYYGALPPTFRKGRPENTTLQIPNPAGLLPATKTTQGLSRMPIVAAQPSMVRDPNDRHASPNVLLANQPSRKMGRF
ncbi:hypothetical protein BJ165DRAFT_1596007 [Panaeolus papilionaceus]|nr:hypothetical protein BJ165DRAFT_1596007 [Panaeolus papilionaceus]